MALEHLVHATRVLKRGIRFMFVQFAGLAATIFAVTSAMFVVAG
jgi:hypothetical protein